MPTKDEVRKFLEEHTPGKPEIRGLHNSFIVEWGDDVFLSMYVRDDNYITIRNHILSRDPDQALEFGTLYLSVVDFAHKLREFMTTS